jgi:hypothetical protein
MANPGKRLRSRHRTNTYRSPRRMGSSDRRICLRSGAPSAVCGRRHRKTRTHPNPLPLVRGTAAGRTPDPSTSLRFGRDDKGRGAAKVRIVAGWGETAGPSVPLTTPTLATALPLSSRPKRSEVEGSAVRPAALSISPGSALNHPPKQLHPADSARTLPVALRCRLRCRAV